MVAVPKDGAVVYGDAFAFDVAPEHPGELRVQLFKKRRSVVEPDVKAVVANAGVFVKNIVMHIAAHGDIEKDFKLFAKGGQPSGGFVRLRVAFEATDPAGARASASGDERAERAEKNAADPAADAAAAKIQAIWKGKKARETCANAMMGKKKATDHERALSPASVAVACGAVAAAAFAASVGVARGRRGSAARQRV